MFGWKHHSVDKGLVNQPLVKGHTHTTQLYHQNMTFTCGSTIKLPNFPLSSSLVSEINFAKKHLVATGSVHINYTEYKLAN